MPTQRPPARRTATKEPARSRAPKRTRTAEVRTDERAVARRATPAAPQQARSRARVDRILEVADRLLVDEGFDAFTIRRLAEVAQVPTGTIYRFFADKQHVVDLLAQRYLATFLDAMTAMAEDPPSPDDLVDHLLDVFVALNREQPGYRLLWTGRHFTPEQRAADTANDLALAAALHGLLHGMGLAEADDPEIAAGCRATVLAASAVLEVAFRDDPRGEPLLLDQLRLMITAYVASLDLTGSAA